LPFVLGLFYSIILPLEIKSPLPQDVSEFTGNRHAIFTHATGLKAFPLYPKDLT
jgi:hypothetical protein